MTTRQLNFGRSPSNEEKTRLDWVTRALRLIEEVSSTWLQIITGYIDIEESTAPSNPPAATARLFVRDDGSGNTQLCVIFPSGTVVPIATE
jgi:hypothetical protein